MTTDEEQDVTIRPPGCLTKAFTVVAFLFIITVFAFVGTCIAVAFSERSDMKWTIFALAWGLVARYFQWTVYRGIKATLASDQPQEERARILGEQVWAIPFFKRVIELEIMASFVWLLVRLIG